MKNTISTESKQNRQVTGFYRGNIAVITCMHASIAERTIIIKEIVKIRCPHCGALCDEVNDKYLTLWRYKIESIQEIACALLLECLSVAFSIRLLPKLNY